LAARDCKEIAAVQFNLTVKYFGLRLAGFRIYSPDGPKAGHALTFKLTKQMGLISQLKLYSKYFPIETFHFIKFEEINQKPLQTIQRVFEFLGVHNGFVPPLLMKKWTPATNVAMDMGALKGKILYTSVGARLCRRFFRKVGFSQVKTYNKFSPPPLDPEVKRRLTRVYDDDLKLLMDLSKQDYSSWLSSGQ